jgi:membrane protein implicated in regulation of membrane protease activity
MNSGETMLAAVAPLPQWANFLALFAVIVLSAFGVFLWAVLFRKKRKRKHHSRQRREQRKLNPTLAESGGLPPAREEKNTDASTP